MKTAYMILSLTVTALLGSAAQGEVKTFVAEGAVTSITDPLGTLNFTQVGAPVSFRFSFDSTSPDLNETPTLGQYQGVDSELLIGGVSILAGQPFITIQHPSDLFTVDSTLTKPGFLGGASSFVLEDQVASTALTSPSLPETPYPLELFENRWLSIAFYYPNPGASSPYTLGILASVDAFYVVPEPCSFCFFFAAACCLFRRRSVCSAH